LDYIIILYICQAFIYKSGGGCKMDFGSKDYDA